MYRFFLTVIVAIAAQIFASGLVLAEKRVALVIGNSAYTNAAALANPKNDASALSAALERLDFEVIKGLDLNKGGFEQKVREFTRAIRGADIALLFFAGHGLQVAGRNYLAPVDAALLDESDLDFETIPLRMIMRQMEREARVNLVFLDACRDNPLARNLASTMGARSASVGRGLAAIETGVGTLISYATQPGNVALDGKGENSPFTKSLLNHIETPDTDIAVVLRKVRGEVIEETNGKQVPWDNSSLTGSVVLNSGQSQRPKNAQPAESQTGPSPELSYWESIKQERDPEYFKQYLLRYPDGMFAEIARLRIAKSSAIVPPAKAPRDTVEPAQERLGDLGLIVRTSNSFKRYACGVIVDERTGLGWLVGPDRTLDWNEADSWVRAARACGFRDWSLPSADQLRALYDSKSVAGIGFHTGGRYWPAKMDSIFSDIGSGSWVWSLRVFGTEAEAFNYNQGLVVRFAAANKYYTTRAFAVRQMR